MCLFISTKFFWEQDMAKSSDEFENGCIPMHCGARVAINVGLSNGSSITY